MPTDVTSLLARSTAPAVEALDPESREALKQDLLHAILDLSPPEERAVLSLQLRPEALRYMVSFSARASENSSSSTAMRDSLIFALLRQYAPASTAARPEVDPSAPGFSASEPFVDEMMEVRVLLEDRQSMPGVRALLIPGTTEAESPLLVLPAARVTANEQQLGLRLAATYSRLWNTGAKSRERVVFHERRDAQVQSREAGQRSSNVLEMLRRSPRAQIAGVGEGPSTSFAIRRR